MTGTAELFQETGTIGAAPKSAPGIRFVAPVLIASAGLFGTGSAGFQGNSDLLWALRATYADVGTISTWSAETPIPAPGRQVHESLVRRVQRESGLTWGEVARALGVSRRAVHHWASDDRISERNARRLEAFYRLVRAHAGLTPANTRARLREPGTDGRSALLRFEIDSRPRRAGVSQIRPAEILGEGELSSEVPSRAMPRPSSLKASRLRRPPDRA